MGNDVQIDKKAFIGKASGDFLKKYVVQKELGSGAFGNVVQVQNINTHKVYACKQIKITAMKSPLESLLNEINIMIEMDHPNIVRIYEYYVDDQYVKIIMEQCKGGELFDTIVKRADEGKSLTEKEAAYIFKQVISAVNYCHQNGICHRDLKPENILLANEDTLEIKLIDFGLSKHYDSSDMVERVGTCYYMAPEVLEGNYNEKCDIWSCGVILYVLLVANFPFNGYNDQDIMEAVKSKQYDFPEELFENISEDAKNIISRMLVDMDIRPSAEDILQDPWIAENAPNSKENLQFFNSTKFKQFAYSNKLKKAVLSFKASRATHEEKEKYDKLFREIDKDGNGKLSKEEIQSALATIEDTKITNVDEVFAKIDTDDSGTIDYNEFIAASLSLNEQNNEGDLRDAFDMFDIDKSGKISRDEIAQIFKGYPDSEYINDIMKKYDINKDGEIDFNEFILMMKDN